MGQGCFEESIWKIIKGVNNMLEEDDGLGFADFLASVQEEEKSGIKLSHIGFLNGKIYAIVNDFYLALYDGDNLELETNVPETLIDKSELESQLDEVFESYIPNPFVKALQNLNSCCEHDRGNGTLITDDYIFDQYQEGYSQGWTLVYRKKKTGRELIAYMNWQACGCHVETIDEEFYNFLHRVTEKGSVYAELNDPILVDFDTKYFWETIGKILKVKDDKVRKEGKIPEYFDIYSEKEEMAWRSELMNDLSCGTLCDEDYYNAKDSIGYALKDAKAMAKSNPKCLYRGKELTRRLIRELLKDAEDSVNGD